MNIELGIIDSMWDVSIHPMLTYVVINATSPHELDNGWYCASVGYDGSLIWERRMLASGNYDPEPKTNRPRMQSIIASIPSEHDKAIEALNKVYM